MARKKREWYPGQIMHVMNRGGSHKDIFKEKMDYEYFLMLLKDCRKRYACIIHAYCLMTNHYHLLLETSDKEIWYIMKRIDQMYTGYFNKKYGKDGALLRGRYKACDVASDSYFLQTSRYISLNPVNAKMVSSAEQYKWSSYRTMIGLCDDGVTEVGKTLLYFKDCSRSLYREFVEAGEACKDEIDLIISQGIGDEEWLPW